MFWRVMFVFIFVLSGVLRAGVVYQTDFEDCTDSIPPGWLLYDVNGDGHYFAARNYSSYAHSGSWFIRYAAYYANVDGDDWAISDTFTLHGNEEDTLIFYVRAWSSSYPERLRVYLIDGDTPGDTAKLLWRDDSIVNTTYQQKVVIFRPPRTSTYRLGFYSNSFADRRAVLVDDIQVMSADVSGNNLAIDEISPFYDFWGDAESINQHNNAGGEFKVVVRNYGAHDFNHTRTFYRIDSAGVTIVPETQIGNERINAGETKTYTFTFTPSIYHMTEYDIYVYHNKVNDNNNTYRKDDTFHMHFLVKGHQGRDAYGWVWRDSYSLLGPPEGVQWIELSADAGAVDLGLGDEGNSYQTLASSIKFYGADYYGINIDPNGIISFDQEPTGNDYENDSIPSSNASAALMPFWEDLDPGSGGAVYYKTFADTLTVIEWYQVPIYRTNNTVTFEVQIQSNLAQSGVYDNVSFLYYDMNYDEDGMDATIGIQDSSARNGSGKFLYYTFNEQPFIPNWKYNKGIFVIKFYSPEALKINEIAYENLEERSGSGLVLQSTLDVPVSGMPTGVSVYDISGRKCMVFHRYDGRKIHFDFNSLDKGIYFIQIATPDKQKELKIIKLQ